MVEQILDLHTHSRYSRACSKDLVLPNIARACETRGIQVVVTGDFTHPKWFEHIKDSLVEDNEGVYVLKDKSSSTKFILGTEIASIKKHNDQTRRLHLLVFAPSIEAAEKFNRTLESKGFNVRADGRPIIGLTAKDLLVLMREVDERMVMIPAHAWTPWFGVFGSKGGYNSLEEAFEELTPYIRAIETGLSSDPLMNARLTALDAITLISNSDAHSLAKLGREANVLQFSSLSDITYDEIMRIIQEGDPKNFLYTIEFYPEEGKYHYDGHRECDVFFHPRETKKLGGICPICKRPLTIGVMYRVEELADRTEIEAASARRIPHRSLVPLPEIIADTLQLGVSAKKVQITYHQLIKAIGSEFYILLHATLEEIKRASTPQIADAVDRVRKGNILVKPGYDGVFGIVSVFGDKENRGGAKQGKLTLDEE